MQEIFSNEVLVNILKFLDEKSLSRLSSTSFFLNTVIKDDLVWKDLYKKIVTKPPEKDRNINYFDACKELYGSLLLPIKIAEQQGKISECMQLAPMQRPIDRRKCPYHGYTPLAAAIEADADHLALDLLERGACSSTCVDNRAYQSLCEPVGTYLDVSGNEELKTIFVYEDNDVTPLHIAADKNNLKLVKALLDNPKCDVNALTEYEINALSLAIANENLEMIKLFLQRGIKINYDNYLHAYKNLTILNILVTHDNFMDNLFGDEEKTSPNFTWLSLATSANNFECFEYTFALMKESSNVNSQELYEGALMIIIESPSLLEQFLNTEPKAVATLKNCIETESDQFQAMVNELNDLQDHDKINTITRIIERHGVPVNKLDALLNNNGNLAPMYE